jgi:hypothetical protein
VFSVGGSFFLGWGDTSVDFSSGGEFPCDIIVRLVEMFAGRGNEERFFVAMYDFCGVCEMSQLTWDILCNSDPKNRRSGNRPPLMYGKLT